jgi:hypothetical protein
VPQPGLSHFSGPPRSPGAIRPDALTFRVDVSSARQRASLFLVYLGLQALAVVGLGAGRFPDSVSYESLSLTGNAMRLPTVPLVYWIFRNDDLRVAFQVVLAACAWTVLAWVAGDFVRDGRVRLGLRLVLLAIGLAGPVVSWNTLILSESISISLTALACAAWLWFARSPAWGSVAAVAVAMLFWTFARQPHVLFVAIVTAVVFVYAVSAAGLRRRLAVVLGSALLLITSTGFLEISRNQTISRRNVGAIIQMRILPNRDWTIWFERRGMPYSREIAGYAGAPYKHPSPLDATARTWVEWVDTKASRLYLRFVLEHPYYLWVKPLPFLVGEQPSLWHPTATPFGPLQPNPTPSLLSPSVDYGRHRNLLPSVLDQLLFDQGEVGDLLLVLGLTGAFGIAAWRRWGPDRRVTVPVIAALLVLPQAYAVWLSGGEAVGELDRLSIVNAVQVRIALWILLALALDRFAAREP